MCRRCCTVIIAGEVASKGTAKCEVRDGSMGEWVGGWVDGCDYGWMDGPCDHGKAECEIRDAKIGL